MSATTHSTDLSSANVDSTAELPTSDIEKRARAPFEAVGMLVMFAAEAFRGVPTALRLYPSEVFKQCATLIRANALIVLFMACMLGALLGINVHYVFVKLGIESYISGAYAIANLRGIAEVVFGWIVAAKIGCGIVAEIGAMRISDEIDAMEVMGIRSIAWLASTRIISCVAVIPFLWITSMCLLSLSEGLVNVVLLKTTSSGAFINYLFLFQGPREFVFAVIWATFLVLMIVTIACYYGFTAKGGPVGVGNNTAKSMLVNLVLISVTAMLLVQLFYGSTPNAPIGN